MADPSAIPRDLIQVVENQSAVLFLGAAASYGASHPRAQKIPSAGQLRDLLADQFLGGEEKTKPLATVAELAVTQTRDVN